MKWNYLNFAEKKGIYPSTLDKWKQACLENIDIEAGKKFKKKREAIKTKDSQVRKRNKEERQDHSRDYSSIGA